MAIELRHLVLYVVEKVGDHPNGKTYLQKVCFFVEKLIGQPLGFRAHYYGPYSDQVSAELAFLTASGFVYENRRGSGIAGSFGWEIAQFDYHLTDQGVVAVNKLRAKHPEQAAQIADAVQKVLQAGTLDYIELSFAAKTFWILNDAGGPMTPHGIAEAATRFRWDVKNADVSKAVKFLQDIGLVEIKQAEAH